LTASTKLDARKAKTTKAEAKKAYEEAVESCEETSSSSSTDAQENAFKQESIAKDEQRLAIEDEISEIKLIAESTKKSE
jgi:L-lactate utilization protein LutC